MIRTAGLPAYAARPRGRPREFDIDKALDQAIRVFREHGYNATSIGDLISAMGLASGSIYKAFKDKRAVFLAAFDRYMSLRNDQLRQVADTTKGGSSIQAQENAKKGITVNAICPGYIHTEMLDTVPPEVMAKSILPLIPVGRLGEPGDIARAVLFLAADEATFITGSTLSINGGQYMS